ncbi:MAG: AAA family ATPase [Prolixibacteraceae bacterium]|jgi:AAA15 family ATPase/GTPase|nr:AAA family ATPase [Prolixibacteraceae bacterium]
MILELKIKNFLSFKNEVTLSFEATKDKKLEDYQVVEIAKGIRVLKLGVIYGANASGKSNLLNAFEFLRDFWFNIKESKEEETNVIPFLLDAETPRQPSILKLTFFAGKEKNARYVYTLEINDKVVLSEKLEFYPGVQPAIIFERSLVENISELVFGPKIKISQVAKDEIAIKCLTNMSVFAAYNQVNTKIEMLQVAADWMANQFMPSIEPGTSLLGYSERLAAEDESAKNKLLTFLRKADLNISAIESKKVKEVVTDDFINKLKVLEIPKQELDRLQKERSITQVQTTFEHEVINDDKTISHFSLPVEYQSDGTKRIFGLSGAILSTIRNDAFLAIDELESKLHPRMIEFVLEEFLKESKHAQLLVTTHYDGLLDEDDLLRKDSIWFTEKQQDASSNLYSLADFNGINRLTSIQKAYRFGKFGAIPNIG